MRASDELQRQGRFLHRRWRNVWEKRAATRRYEPGLIDFQEFHHGNREVYERELPGYTRLPGPVYGTGQFEDLDSGGFWLSDTPDEYSTSWGNEVIRSANWAVLRCRQNGATFLHVNTHLDHVSEPARVQGSGLILRQSEEIRKSCGGLPTVVTGDFNCTPGTRPYGIFLENGFVDTFLAAGNEDDAYTFHAFKGARFTPADTDKPTGRIDWILVRDEAGRVKISSHEILRDGDEAAGTFPSDHYPVLAELELTG